MLSIASSPLQKLQDTVSLDAEVTLMIKRDDLLHPLLSGNKWRKLKYNLEEYRKGNYKGILSFGGAYSNHLYSLSAACNQLQIPCTFLIRGEPPKEAGFTLQSARDFGTEIIWLSRDQYRIQKNSFEFLQGDWKDYFLIPEGGSNNLGISGVADLVSEIETPVDYWITALGTGGTLAGLVRSIPIDSMAIGVSCLKAGGEESNWINHLIYPKVKNNFQVINGYEHGGYAKITQELVHFMNYIFETHSLKLDPVYTAKALFAVHQLLKEGYFKKGSKVLFIHTGGLQGIFGMEKKLRKLGLCDAYFRRG